MHKIDIENWNRKEHYEFFSKMKSPFVGLTTEVDCTIAYQQAKTKSVSFYAWYLYKSVQASNRIEEMKLRIVNDEVVCVDTLGAGSTALRKDGTFSFIYVPYADNFDDFYKSFQKEIDEVNHSNGMRLNDDDVKISHIRYSVVPWISFTSIMHPTNFNAKDAVPRIVFGKYHEVNGRLMMPVSVEVHHGLMDGYHIARYLEEFQNLLNEQS